MEIFLSKLIMQIIYTLQFVPVVWAFDELHEPRFSKKASYITAFAVHFAVISIHLTVTHFEPDMGTVGYFIYDVLRFVVTSAGLVAAYTGSAIKMFFTFLTIFYGCSSLASGITSVFIPYGEDAELLQDYPVLAAVMCIFFWLLVPLAVMVIKKIDAKSLPKHFWLYLIFPVAQFASSVIISDMLVFVPEEEHQLKIFAFFVNLIGIGADIALMLIIIRMNEHEEERKRLETEAYIKRSEETYYDHINEKLHAAMKVRHDVKNVIIAAEKLINDNDSKEYGEKLVDVLKSSYDDSEPKYYCEHRIINAVLYDKIERAAVNGININVNAAVPDDISIDCYDLCRVVSNVLDNAAESAVQTEERRIDFRCHVNKGYLYIESNNSCLPEKIKKGFRTTKADKHHHGYGIGIIKEIARRYNGETKFASNGNSFSCKVWLKV